MALISASGLYTAPATVPSGSSSVTISATSQADAAASGSATVSLSYPVPTVSSVSPDSATVDSASLTITVNGANFTSVSTVSFGKTALASTFVSSSKLTATVPASSLKTQGTVDIGVSNPTPGGGAAPAPVQFQVEAPTISSITLSPSPVTLFAGQTQQLTATANYSDSSTKNVTSTVTWSSSNSSVATVSGTGLVTALASGQANVSAALSGVSRSDTVTVTAVTTTLSPTSAGVLVDSSQQFAATVTGAANSAVTWSVNGITGGNSTVGTVSTAGLYTAPATVPNPATVTVTATSQADTSASASATVTVKGYRLTTLYSFCSQSNCADGTGPRAGLVQGTDGNFHGTTFGGGSGSGLTDGENTAGGTVFQITPGGALSTLYSFCSQSNCADGAGPEAGLVQGTDGNYYGTTFEGGSGPQAGNGGGGTAFKITAGGTLTTLYSFCSQANCADGAGPEAGLVQGTDGNFYGTTTGESANGGTVFQITPGGALTTLYSFCSQADCTDGKVPLAVLVQGADGNFYGTTLFGGANGGGTVFRVTPAGTLTTLYSFCSQSNCTDGDEPYAGLAQGTDGNFYGTTFLGGAYADAYGRCVTCGGTVFKITPGGALTTLYSFCVQISCPDGAQPRARTGTSTEQRLWAEPTATVRFLRLPLLAV